MPDPQEGVCRSTAVYSVERVLGVESAVEGSKTGQEFERRPDLEENPDPLKINPRHRNCRLLIEI